MINKKIVYGTVILCSTFLFSACGSKKTPTPTPTPTPRLTDIKVEDRPIISLIPRADGHLLTLKIVNVPNNINAIEYELIYSAVDQGNEIEKGLGDTIKDISPIITKDMLLGTESCTNGCKYKYDEAVNGGTLTLNFMTTGGQVSTYQTPFVLKTTAEIKKEGSLSLPVENFSIKASPTTNEFFVLLHNYKPYYSVFSSGSGKGSVSTITPSTVTKTDLKAISGDYLIP